MHSWNRNVAIVIVFAGAFLLSSPAEAKGFFLITYGEKIVDVGVVAAVSECEYRLKGRPSAHAHFLPTPPTLRALWPQGGAAW